MSNPTVQKKVEKEIEDAIRNGVTEISIYGIDLEYIPESLKRIPGLKKLTVEYSYLPEWIADIESLEYLRITESNINDLLDELHRLKNLKHLEISYCCLEKLPDSLCELKNLEYLNLDGADFVDALPEWIADLTKLHSISLKHCEIINVEKIFEVLSRLSSLKYLHITRFPEEDGQNTLPDSLGNLTNLETLDLSSWHALESIPDTIGNLKKLKVLDLSDECETLAKLPDAICTLPLEDIDVGQCYSLRELPKDFNRITTLKKLSITDCPIKSVSLSGQQLQNLESLWIDFPFPEMEKCVNLKELGYFSQHVFTVFPYDYGGSVCGTSGKAALPPKGLKKLECLHLGGGMIEDTSFLSELTALKELSLYCNMTSLPSDIGKLKNLKELYLWGAESLYRLPESFGDLESLEEIHFTDCGVEEVPESVGRLKNLRRIRIDGARGMKVFPANWYLAKSIEHINIENCISFQVMPDGVSKLKELKYLRLWHNLSLRRLPMDLCKLGNLENLIVHHSLELTELPEGWDNMISLQEMVCYIGTPVEILPASFFKIPNLLFLEYVSNTMKELPESFSCFPSLKKLELCWCHQLERINKAFTQKSRLENIEFACCDFPSLPAGLEDMKCLKSYQVRQCSNIKDMIKTL